MGKIIIEEGMTAQEKEILIKILYHREAVLASDFIEMEKVRRKVAASQKIQIVDHKTWQVLGVQISKALTFTVIDMLQEKLKMGVIKPFLNPYQNLLYFVKKNTSG